MEKHLNMMLEAANLAASAIMDIYQSDNFGVQLKSDDSPLTRADLAAHKIICEYLQTHSQLPILSEEGANIPWSTRRQWHKYFLIDPIDGTKEFIKRNGEFTVNIALIESGKPVVGVVWVPAKNIAYWGGQGLGAFKGLPAQPQAIQVNIDSQPVKVVASRSHPSVELTHYLQQHDSYELVSVGSSLKLCLIAEGSAQLYPRLGPTSEWDTAAGHAVVLAAGGEVLDWQSQQPLLYNQTESLLNPYFIAKAV
ncbi:3'(2'),5'-bisphosphate nucleotidase CysQ [Paraferrimonas sp. SM1919]|uniref:3'(2'),5'-bisphosphate nucleotidase CysQ n=1 Tax=Paraferrimonas sp. SM1919 TaxID=2662263 RepID=UPI0013D3D9B6|nr:3'(2'),5'-bisphosphate nucleotidase CysQ [Paraferrimonas sp. SM1919]